jgi:hypothetical protein
MSEHLPFPDKHPGPRQNEQSNRTDCVKDIRNPDSIHPSRHGEDEDGAEHIPQESECSQRVTDDFCRLRLANVPQQVEQKREDSPL